MCSRPTRLALLLSVTAICSYCLWATSSAEEPLKKFPNSDFEPSIVQLLASPDRYHGQRVRIAGFLNVEFEGNAIYLSEDDSDYFITSNGFWVEFDQSKVPFEGIVGPRKFDRHYVLIEGVFDKNNRGHKGGWQGAIEGVSRVELLRKRS